MRRHPHLDDVDDSTDSDREEPDRDDGSEREPDTSGSEELQGSSGKRVARNGVKEFLPYLEEEQDDEDRARNSDDIVGSLGGTSGESFDSRNDGDSLRNLR